MYQQDIFYECTVERKVPGSVKVMAYISAVLAFLNVLMMPIFPPMLIMALLFAVLAWYNFQHTSLSFDYSYTNGELDIDKVIGGRKRKNVITTKEANIVVLAPTHTDPVRPYIGKSMPVKDCSSHIKGKNYYVMIVKDELTATETKVIFEPSIEILDILQRMNPSRVTLSDEDKARARKLS
jgi:hypothetical protein